MLRAKLSRLKWASWHLVHRGDPARTSAAYWTAYNVTGHAAYASREASLEALHWRTAQYVDYDRLMPWSGFDGKVVADYGCGPGHDLVGFLESSRPRRLIGFDVSPASLGEARRRLRLHPGGEAETILLDPRTAALPLPDGSVDYLHSSGVLHHLPPERMEAVLREFARVLAPGGFARVMVYHRESLMVHLCVAWEHRLLRGVDARVPLEEAIRRSTDGPGCPISRCYRPEEFLAVAARCGLAGSFRGAAVSCRELDALPSRFRAILDPRLPREHREFLLALRFDDRGVPGVRGVTAGFDAVFELRPAGAASAGPRP